LSQVIDLDNSLEVTRQELGKLRARADEEDERWRAREQELLMRLEDSRCRERKLEDQKHNLEVCLADATQQLQELKVFSRKIRSSRISLHRINTGVTSFFFFCFYVNDHLECFLHLISKLLFINYILYIFLIVFNSLLFKDIMYINLINIF